MITTLFAIIIIFSFLLLFIGVCVDDIMFLIVSGILFFILGIMIVIDSNIIAVSGFGTLLILLGFYIIMKSSTTTIGQNSIKRQEESYEMIK